MNGARNACMQVEQPKRYVENDSRDLGQNLLTGEYGKRTIKAIIKFIPDDK